MEFVASFLLAIMPKIYFGRNGRAMYSSNAPKNAEHGIVRSQAHTMLRAIPQRTADILCIDPAPTIAPVIVCVVLSGMPRRDRNTMVTPPPVSAQKPPTGCSFVKRIPRVFYDSPAAKVSAHSDSRMARKNHP